MSEQGNPTYDDTLEKMLSFNYDQPIKEEITFEDSDDEETLQLELEMKKELFDKLVRPENILKLGAKRKLLPLNENETNLVEVEIKPEVVAFPFEQNDNIIITPSDDETSFNVPAPQEKVPESSKQIQSEILNRTNTDTTSEKATSKSSLQKTQPYRGNCEPKLPSLTEITEENFRVSNNNRDLCSVLLKTLVENIFMILPYLNKYLKSKALKLQIEEAAKQQFEKVKFHCFCLSYSTVVSVLLPQKDNISFMNKFQWFIKNFADSKGECTSSNNINVLCNELLQWTENKKNKITSEVHVTQNTEDVYQNMIVPPKFAILKECLSKEKHAFLSLPINIVPKDKNIIQTTVQNLRQARKPNSKQLTYNEHNTSLYFNNLSVKTNEGKRKIQSQYSEQVTNKNITQNAICTCNMCKLPQEGNKSPKPKILKTKQGNKKKNSTQRNGNIHPYFSHNGDPPPYPQERSISRDSGYLSPVTNQSMTMASMDRVDKGETVQNPYPVIVNVTSMHPYLNQKPEHVKFYCQVCQNQTHLRCLGCFLIYYCNENCQEKDWAVHKDFCLQQQEKRKQSLQQQICSNQYTLRHN